MLSKGGFFFSPLSLFLLFHIILERIVSHCGVFYEADLPRRRRARLDEKQGVSLTLQVGPDTGPDATAGSGHGGFGLVSATCNPQFWALSQRPLTSLSSHGLVIPGRSLLPSECGLGFREPRAVIPRAGQLEAPGKRGLARRRCQLTGTQPLGVLLILLLLLLPPGQLLHLGSRELRIRSQGACSRFSQLGQGASAQGESRRTPSLAFTQERIHVSGALSLTHGG